MKNLRNRIVSFTTILTLIVSIIAVGIPLSDKSVAASNADIKWTEGIEGGAIYFNKETGIITDLDWTITKLAIPKEIEGIEVKGIYGEAKNNCFDLEHIVVSDDNPNFSVENDVLFNKNKTELILYPQKLADTEYKIPNGVIKIDDYAFANCQNLKNIVIPSSVDTIGEAAFMTSGLNSVDIPEGVTTIGKDSFTGSNISKVTIPSSVTKIGSYAFAICPRVQELQVSLDNANYSSMDGVLFNKDKTILKQYPIGNEEENYEVPNSVELIEKHAFSFNEKLNAITILDNVKNIDYQAFFNCANLTIYGYEGSYIQTYANNNNIPFVVIEEGNEEDFVEGYLSVSYKPTSINGGDEKELSVEYSDEYFTQDNSEYNMNLSKASLAMALSTMKTKKNGDGYVWDDLYTKAYMKDELKLDYEPYNESVLLTDTSDKVAFSIGNKTVKINGKETTILAVAIRSGNYGGEWYSNGQVEGGYKENLHNGFSSASLKVAESISAYMKNNNIDENDVKIWISGFSRGGAVANILGRDLVEMSKVKSENLYCYTFATPLTTQYFEREQRGIFNTINVYDVIPSVPLSDWGFGRYGTNMYFPIGRLNSEYSEVKDKFTSLSGEKYGTYLNHIIFKSKLLGALNSAVGYTEDSYYKFYQNDVSKLLNDSLGGSGEDIDLTNVIAKVLSMNSATGGLVILEAYATLIIGGADLVDLMANGENSMLMKQHWPETYAAWLEQGTVYKNLFYKVVSVKCPVDVYVYEGNALVAKIKNEDFLEYQENNPDIALESYIDENGEKQVLIPGDSDYRIEIVARDDGEMKYSVSEYNNEKIIHKISYTDIELKKGDSFKGDIPEGDCEAIKYQLTKNDESKVGTINELAGDDLKDIMIDAHAEGDGVVLGGGSYNAGDSVVLTSYDSESVKFTGWYENGEQISKESTYGFLAKENREIIGKFKTDMAAAEITLETQIYNYTGKEIMPKPKVKYNSKVLKEGTDYVLNYKNNIEVGKASIVISGIGNFTGEMVINFEIKEKTVIGEGIVNETENKQGADSGSVKTNDSSNILIWICLLAASMVGILGTGRSKKKKKYHSNKLT